MSPADREAVPRPVDPETTGVTGVPTPIRERIETAVHIARLEIMAEVDAIVTNARASIKKSIETDIVRLPSVDKIDAIVTDVKMLATKESVDALSKRLDQVSPPTFWQVVGSVAALLVLVGGLTWKAHDEVSVLDKRAAVIEVQITFLKQFIDIQSGVVTALLNRRP